ncbi:MAG TPA: efflux RND transporter permease subunit [Gemmataceae bacterium]|nr:efflux RND transporter permease subunit [Gemmataceae bacterium]
MSSSFNPIVFALRHPITVMAAVAALAVGAVLAVQRMAIDIFPTLDLPVIYIAQPYGGMSPGQMESQITSFYEGHSLYITGIHHVESKNVQGMALVKLYFHPGTNMAQAMAETIGYANRSKGYVPQGTVPPFIVRFDTGSVPVGYLVLESDDRGKYTMGQLQDMAIYRVRPIFGSLQGVSSPPPIGGNTRAIVVNVDPDKLRSYHLSLDDVVSALNDGNTITPAGNVRIHDQVPMVPINAMVRDPQELNNISLKPGGNLYLRDVARVEEASDIPTGYALVNGKRTVYMLVTKRADASTLAVVNSVKENLGRMQDALPPDVHLRFEFDQSPYVKRAMWGVGTEGLLGAVLTGLMVLVFLRDWRSVLVVVLNIPLALMGALVALWATGQTINLMTLGGLALAVGILVDEATVEVENIHVQMGLTDSVALAVRRGNTETAVPRLLAMLCIVAVFLPVFFMEGAARNMFVPLALAVGFSMITSYLLSSMFVPVVSVWLLRHHGKTGTGRGTGTGTGTGAVPVPVPLPLPVPEKALYTRLVEKVVRHRWPVLAGYLAASALVLWLVGSRVGMEIFPNVDSGQFQLRLRAPTGTRIERTEEIAKKALDVIAETAGRDKVDVTVGYVGMTPPSYSNQSIYLWSSGPGEAILRVAFKPDSGVCIEELKSRLRRDLPEKLGAWLRDKLRAENVSAEDAEARVNDLRLSFEPADIVNEVMSFGSPTPVEVVMYGPNMTDNLAYADKVRRELERVPALRDLQVVQAQNYPTVDVNLDRERLGQSGVTVGDVTRSVVAATSSSRYVVPNYWADLSSGNGYQVQVQIPTPRMDSAEQVGLVPVKQTPTGQLLLRDVARVREGMAPAEYDRFNLRRLISLTANVEGSDLGRVSGDIQKALDRAGKLPRGVTVDLRGQVAPMREMFRGLAVGLGLSVLAIFLLLTAYFQSPKLALVAVAAVPAVLAGVVVVLLVTHTTLNIQSFMGAIMATGVAVANAILLVTFAERHRKAGPGGAAGATEAAVEGAQRRLRPILMTSLAMLAGMIPMALALGEGGEQTAPLGRAVIGGLVAATFTTLLVLPAVFAAVQGGSRTASASLDPADPESAHFHPEAAQLT